MSELDPTDTWAQFLESSNADPALDHDELEMLTRTRATLRQPEVWDGPSAGARDRLLTQARSESPQVVSISAPRRKQRSFIAAGLAVAAAAIIAVLLLPTGPQTTPSGTTYEVAGGAFLPEASAKVVVDPLANGVKLTITLDDLPPAETGAYYAGWLMGPDGTVPVGSFHARGEGEVNTVSLWSGTETADYPMFMVTLQEVDEPLTPSNRVVLMGPVDGPGN